MGTFNDQSMSIGCVAKFGHLSGFLRHYLLIFINCFLQYHSLPSKHAKGYEKQKPAIAPEPAIAFYIHVHYKLFVERESGSSQIARL